MSINAGLLTDAGCLFLHLSYSPFHREYFKERLASEMPSHPFKWGSFEREVGPVCQFVSVAARDEAPMAHDANFAKFINIIFALSNIS